MAMHRPSKKSNPFSTKPATTVIENTLVNANRKRMNYNLAILSCGGILITPTIPYDPDSIVCSDNSLNCEGF